MYIFGVSWDLSSILKIVVILVVFGYVVYKIRYYVRIIKKDDISNDAVNTKCMPKKKEYVRIIKKDDISNDAVNTKCMPKKKEMVICPECGFIHYDENNPWMKNRNEEYLNNKKIS
ncbi:hypothetical protein [Campylobacter devanensis]|nr:hypothetical protein [Campylobacter sp. P0132]